MHSKYLRSMYKINFTKPNLIIVNLLTVHKLLNSETFYFFGLYFLRTLKILFQEALSLLKILKSNIISSVFLSSTVLAIFLLLLLQYHYIITSNDCMA